MSIDIRKPHSMTLEQAQQVADSLAADLAARFGIDYGWDENTIVFERPGVDGEIDVDPDYIHVRARLGLPFNLMQAAVENAIHRQLEKHFS
ncbi:MAG TPA: polyhydroxyalkanoic acid system family protein [Wenzhouxiangella sp.]|nr:polyhydroxyalkanoic acid system family protein [Wenzhouxiangella sp.]